MLSIVLSHPNVPAGKEEELGSINEQPELCRVTSKNIQDCKLLSETLPQHVLQFRGVKGRSFPNYWPAIFTCHSEPGTLRASPPPEENDL